MFYPLLEPTFIQLQARRRIIRRGLLDGGTLPTKRKRRFRTRATSLMKGIVFTEFLDFVAMTHGDEMVDDVIEDARLPNDGAYTSVGTYDHAQLQRLVAALSIRTNTDVPIVLRQFGRALCGRSRKGYPR